jgi:hypothetical protein
MTDTSLDALSLRTAELRAEMQDLSKLADSFGNKLVGAFAGAIIHGRSLSDVVRGLVLSLSQTALSAALKPVGNLVGNLFSNLFANAKGNVVSAGQITPFASGGIVNSPVLFPMRGGTGLMGEAAGTAATIATTFPLAALGEFLATAGQNGAAGGSAAGAAGAAVTWGGGVIPLCGGAGGAGTTSADFAGGGITGGGWFPSIAGGLAGSNRGQDGFYSGVPFGACGGSGGGSSNASVGAAGGDGAIGCGGGGGGGGTTGGAGGKGGNGLVIITCW